jgi:Ca2+-binding RTX toxin-like protein
VLNGGGGSDRLVGGNGADRYIFGNAGVTAETDTVVELAGGGIDTLDFSVVNTPVTVDLRSDAALVVQNGRKVVTGGSGQAAQLEGIVGGKGDDILRGNNANNYLVGNGGNDVLLGFFGDDTLVGGVGYDSLTGGNGNDKLLGGTGNDTYFFATVAGTVAETDTITELTGEGTDTLDFQAVTTTVTTNLNGNPLASHVRRTVVPGSKAELENVLRSP